MKNHICPRCRKESTCLNPECDDYTLRYEWCPNCRIKLTRYLTGWDTLPMI
jgi:hypothetical protein